MQSKLRIIKCANCRFFTLISQYSYCIFQGRFDEDWHSAGQFATHPSLQWKSSGVGDRHHGRSVRRTRANVRIPAQRRPRKFLAARHQVSIYRDGGGAQFHRSNAQHGLAVETATSTPNKAHFRYESGCEINSKSLSKL